MNCALAVRVLAHRLSMMSLLFVFCCKGPESIPGEVGESNPSGIENPTDHDPSGNSPIIEEPTSVDVGNPIDTGPVGPKSQVYIADAVPSDNAHAVYVTIVGLRLYGAGTTADFATVLPRQRINLMDFSEGQKLKIFDDALPEGDYGEMVIELADDEPIAIEDSVGNLENVYLASRNIWTGGLTGGPQGTELYGSLSISANATAGADITMHVDLRYAVRPMSVMMHTQLGVDAASYDYWMVPEHDSFISSTVGNLILLGLENVIATVICIYPDDFPGLLTPILGLPFLLQGGNDSCYDAQTSAVKKDGEFYLGYLAPRNYRARLFLTPSIFVDLPPLLNVVSNTTTSIDLSSVLSQLP